MLSKRKYILLIIAVSALSLSFLAAVAHGTLNDSSMQKVTSELKEKIAALEKQASMLNSEAAAKSDELSKLKEDYARLQSEKAENESKLKSEVSRLNERYQEEKERADRLQKFLKEQDKGGASDTALKSAYLTFDDGPSENTLKILKILKEHNVPATFFVVGTKKSAYMKQIVEDGHSIALHAYRHDYAKVYKSDKAYFEDLQKISDLVEKETGQVSRLIRFPGGSSNMVSRQYNKGIMTRLTKQVESKGYKYFDWNVDSGDASGNNVPVATILNNVKKNSKGKNSICVLMHDTDAKNTTVQALPGIIRYLKSQKYDFYALDVTSPGFHHGVNN